MKGGDNLNKSVKICEQIYKKVEAFALKTKWSKKAVMELALEHFFDEGNKYENPKTKDRL